MRNWVKPNGLSFQIGSMEWMNFFGTSIAFVLLGILEFSIWLKSSDKQFLFISITLIPLGLIVYYIQFLRLKFRTFPLERDLICFKEDIKSILLSEGWTINYNNKQFLIATYERSIFNNDMLTIRFKKAEIQWNLVRHPDNTNSIATFFTLNRQGNKVMKRIKACASHKLEDTTGKSSPS